MVITINPNKHIIMNVECEYLPTEEDVGLPERIDIHQIRVPGNATSALEWAGVHGDYVFNKIEELCLQQILENGS